MRGQQEEGGRDTWGLWRREQRAGSGRSGQVEKVGGFGLVLPMAASSQSLAPGPFSPSP